jgi:hypothetical protein
MRSVPCAAALSVAAFIAVQSASASFVYQSASRLTTASVAGSVVDSESTTAFGSWFGSASANTASYIILATEGSNLAASEMSFVGASQISASAPATLGATSTATVTFLADASETIRWIADLWRESSGAGNSASIALSVIDLTTFNPLLAFTGPSLGSGSFDVIAGRTYRVNISATADAAGATDALANYNVGFFSTVPTPGALALLGLAGLTGRRRR